MIINFVITCTLPVSVVIVFEKSSRLRFFDRSWAAEYQVPYYRGQLTYLGFGRKLPDRLSGEPLFQPTRARTSGAFTFTQPTSFSSLSISSQNAALAWWFGFKLFPEQRCTVTTTIITDKHLAYSKTETLLHRRHIGNELVLLPVGIHFKTRHLCRNLDGCVYFNV